MGNLVSKEQHKENWQIKKLNDVSKKISLNKLKIKQRDYLPTGLFPVVDQGQELIGGYYNDESLIISDEPPYVIFGDHTKVKKFIPFRFIPGADGVKVLKAKENILPKFLYYLLFTIKIEDKGYARHFQLLEKESFLIPEDLKTQHAIVSKIEELFSELDQGIADLKTAQAQLKVYRQSVLKHAFEGKLTNKNVKEGELPEGWGSKPLKDLVLKVDKVKRKEVDENEELIYLDIGGINNNSNKIENYKKYSWKDAPSRAQQIVKQNDILFSTVRTYMKNIAIVDKEIYNNQIASSGFTVLRAHSSVDYKYVYYNTISDVFLNPLNELQTGTSYPAVRDSDVLSQTINIPSTLEEQHLIVQEIESRLSVADKMEESIQESLQKAEALRQSILKKAFSGELV